ncbi:MAG: PaaI family thioesterase [Myxococcota bacterium]|nr:PaaI family thioesterase [Myxococcota bacterium]
MPEAMLTPKFEFNPKVAENLLATESKAGGLHTFLGIVTIDFGPGTMHAQLEVREELLTPFGNMHGGVLSAFCDHLLGMVCYPVMKKGQWAATTEFKINLTRPVSRGVVDGFATIINLGRTPAVVRIEAQNEERLAAVAQGTVTIMSPR